MTNEKWLPVVGFEGLYEVSDLGRIRSLLHKGKWLRKQPLILSPGDVDGYENYILVKDGEKYNRKGHRLVIEAFVGPEPVGQPEVRHWDGTRNNNVPSNLCWGTRQENAEDMVRHGSAAGALNSRAKLTESGVRKIRERYAAGGVSQRQLAKEYKVARCTIGFAISQDTWKKVA
ncbi:MAG: hypothetical protein E5V63_29885 [Mesorhizobium sp.]|nr:MAG: hypothetical protein E5V63_29885 [Mesorhizobium sp.]